MRVEADRRRAALKLSQLRAQQGQAESDGAVTPPTDDTADSDESQNPPQVTDE